MKVDQLVVRRTEQLLKYLGKDLRQGAVDSSKIGAYSKLLDTYGSLIRLSRALEDEANNYYESMERGALQDAHLQR
jgi:hypothetical protein